jgi:uncharacterized protein YdeI (YjbR/CyaY-like superfamily)
MLRDVIYGLIIFLSAAAWVAGIYLTATINIFLCFGVAIVGLLLLWTLVEKLTGVQ